MKRVKIMLSAILVLAVVAGALAFKAKKLDGFCMYSTTLNGQQQRTCVLDTNCLYTTTPAIAGGITKSSIFTTKTIQCPLFTPTSKCTLTLTTICE